MILSNRRHIAYLVALTVLFVGCKSGENGAESRTISIRQLVALYEGYPLLITEPIAVEGVVVSDDRYGEFYNKVVVEDSTGGVTFMVDSPTLYTLHKMGDILRVDCCGLTIGGYGRAARVGERSSQREVEPLSVARWREQYTFVGVADSLPYRSVALGEVSAELLSTRIYLEGVRFVEAGEKWAPNSESTTRHIVDHTTGSDTLAVRLSGRSDFANEEIPEGECSLFGVLDYFNNHYQLLLASPDEVLSHSEN